MKKVHLKNRAFPWRTQALTALIFFVLSVLIPINGFSREEVLLARIPEPAKREKPTAPQKILAPGKFLLASAGIKDPIFRESVVLLIHYNDQGAIGVIINRPMGVTLSSVFTNSPVLQNGREKFYFGGPVQGNVISFLIRSKTPPPKGLLLFGDVYSSMNQDSLGLFGNEGTVIRAYAGYAGWSPGQLEREVMQGDWYVIPANAASIFEVDPEKVWANLSGVKK